MIKAIFFDFDGVIVESVDIKTEAFARLFVPEGEETVKRVVDYHLGHMGESRFDKIRYIYKEILRKELTDDDFAMLCKRFEALVFEAVVNAPSVNGAEEFFKGSFSKYMCFIVSATPQSEIVEIVRRRGLEGKFNAIFGAPLPKSDAVRQALLENNIASGDAVYIGDAMSDYKAAKDNGVYFIARIYGDKKIFSGIDCLTIDDLSGLENMLALLSQKARRALP